MTKTKQKSASWRNLAAFGLALALQGAGCLPVALGQPPPGDDDADFVMVEAGRLVARMEAAQIARRRKDGVLSLTDPAPDVLEAFKALGTGAPAGLVAAWDSSGDSGRFGIVRILVQLGDPGHQALARLVSRNGLAGRPWIAVGLRGLTTEPLFQIGCALARDVDPEVAEPAIGELGVTEDDRAVVLLRDLCAHKDGKRALRAAQALLDLGDTKGLGRLLTSVGTSLDLPGAETRALPRLRLLTSLGRSGVPAVGEHLLSMFGRLLPLVKEDEEPRSFRPSLGFEAEYALLPPSARAMLLADTLARALITAGRERPGAWKAGREALSPATREILVAGARHRNPTVVSLSVQLMGPFGDASLVPGLLEQAGGEGEELPVQALQSLCSIGASAAREGLQALQAKAPSARLPWTAMALATSGDAEGLGRTIDLANASDASLRAAALGALASCSDAKAIQALATLLDDGDMETRLLALSALSIPGRIESTAAISKFVDRCQKSGDAQALVPAVLGLGLVAPDLRRAGRLESLLESGQGPVRRAAALAIYYVTGVSRVYANALGTRVTLVPTAFHERMRALKSAGN